MQEEDRKKAATKTPQYIALSACVAEIARDPNFNGIVSAKKAAKILELFSELVNVTQMDSSVQSIFKYCFQLITRRPNAKEMNKIFGRNLAKALGMGEGCDENDVVELVSQLRAKNEANVSLKVETVKYKQTIEELHQAIASLNLQISDKDRRIQELTEQSKETPKAEQFQRLLSKTTKQSAKMEEEVTKLKEINEQLISENKVINQRCAALEAQNSVNPEIEELKLKISDKEKEKSRMLQLFEELSQQFAAQTEELGQETKAKSTLVSSIHKLTSMNQYLSDTFAILSKKLSEANSEREALKQQVKKFEIPHQFIEEMDELEAKILNIIPEGTAELVRPILSKQSLSYSERILQTFSVLKEFNAEKEANSEKEYKQIENLQTNSLYDLLLSIISSNIKFLDGIVESKEKSKWIAMPFDHNQMRDIVTKQIKRINDFVSCNNLVIRDTQNVLDSLMLDVNTVDAQSNMSTFLEDFITPETTKEKELFFLLINSIATNDAIRKIAAESRTQCGLQMNEINQLRSELEFNKAELENRINDEQMCIKNQLTEVLDENKKLKEAMSNNESSNHVHNLDCQSNDDHLEDSDGNQSNLIHILEEKTEELSNVQEELAKSKEEKNDLEKKILAMQEENASTNNEYIAHIARIESVLRSTEEELENQTSSLHSEIDTIRKEKDKLSQDLRALNCSNGNQEKLLEQANIIKALKKDKRILEQSLIDQQEATTSIIQRIHQKSKAKSKKLITELSKAYDNATQESTDNKTIIEEKEKQIQLVQMKVDEFSKLTTDLQSELNCARAQLSSTLIENKMLETKLNSKDEKSKREKAMLENQYKLKVLSTETECQAKIERLRISLEAETSQLINTIAALFHSDDENDSQISNQIAIDILNKAADQIKSSQYTEKQLDEAKLEIASARKSISASKSESLVTAASNLYNEYQKAKSQLSQLEGKIKGMKREVIEARSVSQQQRTNHDWEEWARKLNMLVSNGYCSINSPDELRFAVEEVVYAALGNRLTWSRLDSLRAQKRFLISGIDLKKSKGETFRSTIIILTAVRRLQKLSGHVQTTLKVINTNSPERKLVQGQNSIEKKPLFTHFTTQQ